MNTRDQLIAAIDRGDLITAQQLARILHSEAELLREKLRRLGAAITDHIADLSAARQRSQA